MESSTNSFSCACTALVIVLMYEFGRMILVDVFMCGVNIIVGFFLLIIFMIFVKGGGANVGVFSSFIARFRITIVSFGICVCLKIFVY